MEEHTNMSTNKAAFGGIILSILGIHWQDLLQTVLLAAIGTTVSFCISALLKRLTKKTAE